MPYESSFSGKRSGSRAADGTLPAHERQFVQNDSWHSSTGDQCIGELLGWGRFKLVNDKKEADLVMHVTGSIEDRTTLVVTDASTDQKLWTSKPDKPAKVVKELRKSIEEQTKKAAQ